MSKPFEFIKKLTQKTPTTTPEPETTEVPSEFDNLGLSEPILRALKQEGYTRPTPVQSAAIPYILASRDLLGCAQTGTGKTAAFALPTLELLSRQPPTRITGIRALVLTPTRELASQIQDSFRSYGRNLRLKSAVAYGGVGINPQIDALRRGVDILIATPGRYWDLFQRGVIKVEDLSILILDEADRMLDMGFINDIRKILKTLPKNRQNLLFSATIPKEVQEFINGILKNPARVEVTPVSSTTELVAQSVYYVDQNQKRALLLHVLQAEAAFRTLVFTRTKSNANKVTLFLNKAGIRSEAIHGNKSQSARQRALDGFKKGKIDVLVASDVASRGIDVDDISHVINFELPNVPETYVHRIGRTGRAEARGKAISFCAHDERPYLRDIERVIRKEIPVVSDHPFPMSDKPPARDPAERPRRNMSNNRNYRGGQPIDPEVNRDRASRFRRNSRPARKPDAPK